MKGINIEKGTRFGHLVTCGEKESRRSLNGSVRVYEKTGDTGNGNMYYYIKGNNLDRTETSVQRNNTYSDSIVLGNYTSLASGLFNGYLSKFIIEDKVWTTQDVNNYYITTKANYGI